MSFRSVPFRVLVTTEITGEARRTAKTNDNKNFDGKLHNKNSVNQNANSPSSLQYIIIFGILCPVYLFMVILFILCIDAILNDVLTFDIIKNKALKFVGHSTSGCKLQCFKKFLS